MVLKTLLYAHVYYYLINLTFYKIIYKKVWLLFVKECLQVSQSKTLLK